MQFEITEGINAFFAGHLARKPTQLELQKLHDEFTVDFEGMVAHANKTGVTYKALLISTLVDKYEQEIQEETEAFNLQTQFTSRATVALDALVQLKTITEAILDSDQSEVIMDAISATPDLKVTLLEPMMLKLYMDDVFKTSHDIYLKGLVKRKDPTLTAVGDDDKPWFSEIKDTGRVTVDLVKRVRKIFNPSLVDVRDGKRIVELVLEGKIK